MKLQLDNWTTYFDNSNKVLLGKFVFYNSSDDSEAVIYDIEGTNLGNSVYVNGRTDYQVFLDEGEYDVLVFKYIGSSWYKSDEDDSNWLQIRSFHLSVSSSKVDMTSSAIHSIAELISYDTSNVEDGASIDVIGYYTSSDCPKRTYVWNASSNETVDGGVVIGDENATGRWILSIPYDYIDTRWYGDIPQESNEGECYLAQRALAAHATEKWSKRLYFYADEERKHYIFDGSNVVSTPNDIVCDPDAIFDISGVNATTIECKEIIKASNGLLEDNGAENEPLVYADYIYSSWLYSLSRMTARKAFVIDEDVSSFSYIGVNVIVQPGVLTTSSFNNCVFISGQAFLNGNSISNMALKEEWFYDKTVSDYTFENVKFYDKDFIDMDFYIDLKNKVLDFNYGDMHGYELNDKNLYNGCVISNAKGSVITRGDTTISDSELTISSAYVSSVVIPMNLKAVNSTLTFNDAFILGSISNCVVKGSLECYNDTSFINDIIEAEITFNGSSVDTSVTSLEYSYSLVSNSFSNDAVVKEVSKNSNMTRSAKIMSNYNLTFDDSSSNVTSLGSSFEWRGNSDDLDKDIFKQLQFYGTGDGVIPDGYDDDDLGCCLVNDNSGTLNWTFATQVLAMMKVKFDFKQPFTYPLNSVRHVVTFDMESPSSVAQPTTYCNVTKNTTDTSFEVRTPFFFPPLNGASSATCTAVIKHSLIKE